MSRQGLCVLKGTRLQVAFCPCIIIMVFRALGGVLLWLALGLGEAQHFSPVLGRVPQHSALGTSPTRNIKVPCARLASVPCSRSSLGGLTRRGDRAKMGFGNY